MRLWTGLVVFLCACAMAIGGDREQLIHRPGGILRKVGVVGGELRADPKGASRWLVRETPRGTLVHLPNSDWGGAWGGWYLNFDHRGKDPRVGLVPEPGPGCYWTWQEHEGKRQKKPGRHGYGYWYPITVRPANGPMRGWSLALDGDKLILAEKTADEIKFTGDIDDLNDGK